MKFSDNIWCIFRANAEGNDRADVICGTRGPDKAFAWFGRLPIDKVKKRKAIYSETQERAVINALREAGHETEPTATKTRGP
jgi:hypothetical protein